MNITIQRNALKAVSLFAGQKDIRYYLNSVLVECTPLETRLIATDGHACGIHRADAKDENTGSAELIVPNEIVAQLLKLKGGKSLDDVVTLIVPDDITEKRDQECRAEFQGVTFVFKPVEGKFPDYRRIVPSELSGEVAQFNAEFLMRCSKASIALGSKKGLFQVAHNGQGAALASIDTDMVVVIMPFRGEAPKAEDGAWAKAALPTIQTETIEEAAITLDTASRQA
jgi:DNA polymerase-3 subunit beta